MAKSSITRVTSLVRAGINLNQSAVHFSTIGNQGGIAGRCPEEQLEMTTALLGHVAPVNDEGPIAAGGVTSHLDIPPLILRRRPGIANDGRGASG